MNLNLSQIVNQISYKIDESQDFTTNQMDWMNISAIKPKKRIICLHQHQVKDICTNKNCKSQNALICLEDQCDYRSSHNNCQRKPVLGITQMVQKKLNAIESIKLQAEIFFDQKEKQLREFRATFMKEISQMKETAFSDAQIKLKKLIVQTNDKITCTLSPIQSADLVKNHALFIAKGQDDTELKAKSAFKTFSTSLNSAFDELNTDIRQINQDAKNPSKSVTKTSQTIPTSHHFKKPDAKTPNPEVYGRKRFGDLLGVVGFGQQSNTSLRICSKQRFNNSQRSSQKQLKNISTGLQSSREKQKPSNRSKDKRNHL